jgi:hypothetical protein
MQTMYMFIDHHKQVGLRESTAGSSSTASSLLSAAAARVRAGSEGTSLTITSSGKSSLLYIFIHTCMYKYISLLRHQPHSYAIV